MGALAFYSAGLAKHKKRQMTAPGAWLQKNSYFHSYHSPYDSIPYYYYLNLYYFLTDLCTI